MSATTTSDSVSMEFLGPVPGILGATAGYHVVFWVQAGGGAGFTRPSQDERDYYAELGKPVPEWQCEYFDFDGLAWPEAALTVELWHGAAKLRSLCLPGRQGRRESEVPAELPELDYFLQKHHLALGNLTASFHDALLEAAEKAGAIQRGVANSAPRSQAATQVIITEQPWWYRALTRAWARTRAKRAAKEQAVGLPTPRVESA